MQNLCPECMAEIHEENPLQVSEYDTGNPPRRMCASCVQRWNGRIERAAREEVQDLLKQFRQAKLQLLRRWAQIVSVKGPLGGD